MTYDEFRAACLAHNAEFKAVLIRAVTEGQTPDIAAQIEAFRAKDKILYDLHAFFKLEEQQKQDAELKAYTQSLDEIKGIDSLFELPTAATAKKSNN